MNYIQHICKNKKCDRIFLDKDLTNADAPQTWKYCPICVRLGFINPTERPKNLKRVEQGMKFGFKRKELTKAQ